MHGRGRYFQTIIQRKVLDLLRVSVPSKMAAREPVELVDFPEPYAGSRQKKGETMDAFFKRRTERNKRRLELETPVLRQAREMWEVHVSTFQAPSFRSSSCSYPRSC